MKKVSTTARKQSRNFSQPKLTIGLDLGDCSSWYCLLDEVGEVLREQKLGTTPKAMGEVFGALPRCRIALETGMHSPWISRLLTTLGHEVIRGACPQRAPDRGEPKEGRSHGCTWPVKHRSAKAQADLTVDIHVGGVSRPHDEHVATMLLQSPICSTHEGSSTSTRGPSFRFQVP